MMVDLGRCLRCGECARACPQGAIRGQSGDFCRYDRKLCDGCGLCLAACPARARSLSGRLMSTEEVLAVIERDRAFFRRSGGGVTLGGGEPTRQAAFAHDLLRACRKLNLHTALETCGHCAWEILKEMIPVTDLFLYDLKQADGEKHRWLTGKDNLTIIDNLRRLGAASAPLKIRYPLIPGANAARADIAGLIMLVKSLPGPVAVEISPYHRFGEGKYAMLGRDYALKGLETPTPDQVAAVVAQIRSSGISCLALH